MHDNDTRIREKAHELWLAAGSPEGQHLDHWEQAKAAVEKHEPSDTPPAGPHAKPELTNPDATPGSGMFPEAGDEDEATSPASG